MCSYPISEVCMGGLIQDGGLLESYHEGAYPLQIHYSTALKGLLCPSQGYM